jgi:hypothetical protein
MRKIILGLAAALALVGLAACQPDVSPVAPQGPGLTQAEQADCRDHGGSLGRGGLIGGEVCFKPTPDAGKSCDKASDCSGSCMADTRTCSKQTPQFGCFEFLDDQGQKVGLCID